MPIGRTAIVNDDSTGTTGTILDNAWKQELYDQIDAVSSGVIQTTTATGTQNDFALTTSTGFLRCNNATLLTLTGLATGVDGQRLVIVSIGAGQVDLSHQDAGSTAANRLINLVTVGKTSLAPGSGTATLVFDGTTQRWRLVAHAQGAWLTRAFAAGNYTGSGSMTWTVDAGDVVLERYLLSGRTLTVFCRITTTTVGGTPSTALQVLIPGGYSAVTLGETVAPISDNGGATAAGRALINASVIQVFKDFTSTANWAAATNTTSVFFTISFEVI